MHMFMWRAVDKEGEVLDALVQKRRNKAAALRLSHPKVSLLLPKPRRKHADNAQGSAMAHRSSAWFSDPANRAFVRINTVNVAMNTIQALEAARTAAMAANDLNTLDLLLDPALMYSHSTGAVDDKPRFIGHLRSGTLKYNSVVPAIENALSIGDDILVGTGRLETSVNVAGTLKELDSRYMVIWRRTDDQWRLVALQG